MIMAYISQLLWALPGKVIHKTRRKMKMNKDVKHFIIGAILPLILIGLLFWLPEKPIAPIEPKDPSFKSSVDTRELRTEHRDCKWNGLKKRRICGG